VEAAALPIASKEGPEKAQATLKRMLELGAPAYRLAACILGDPGAAEDVIQQAYLAAIEKLRSGSPPVEERTWFLKVVSNTAKYRLRSEANRRRREAAVSDTKTIENRPVDRELSAALKKAFAALEPGQRAALGLCYFDDLTRREAAAVLEIPKSTLADRVEEGLRKLRRSLGKAGYPAATAGVVEGLRHTAPALPAGLAAKLEALVAGAMGAKTALAGGAAAGAGAGLIWKALAGLAATALLVAGFWGGWQAWDARPEPDAGPAAAKPEPRQTAVITSFLNSKVTVEGGRSYLCDVLAGLHRNHALKWSLPQACRWVQIRHLKPGTVRMGKLLESLAESCGMDLEVRRLGNEACALYWDRPDPQVAAKMEERARSVKELDRCVAARWLPALGSRRGLEFAVGLLSDSSPRVRGYAAWSIAKNWPFGYAGSRNAGCVSPLGTMPHPRAASTTAEELERMISKPQSLDFERFSNFAIIAGAFRAREAVPVLLKAVRCRDQIEKVKIGSGGIHRQRGGSGAGRLLGMVGGEEAEKGLLELWREAPGYDIADGLAGIGTARSRRALIEALRSEDRKVLGSAARALGRLGNREAIAPLRAALSRNTGEKNSTATAISIVTALLRIDPEGNRGLALAEVGGTTDPWQRYWFCNRLEAADLAGDWLLPTVEKFAGGKHARARGGALRLLAELGTEKSVDVIEKSLTHKEKYVKQSACAALAAIGGRRAEKLLRKALESGDPVLRRAACSELCGFADEDLARGLLKPLVRDPDPGIRAAAINGLCVLRREEDFELMSAAAVERPKNRALEAACARALRSLSLFNDGRAWQELLRLARSGNAGAVRALLTARNKRLRRLGMKELERDGMKFLRPALKVKGSYVWELDPHNLAMIPHLVRFLGDRDVAVRSAAMSLLSADPRGIEPLCRALLSDADPQARLAAVMAMTHFSRVRTDIAASGAFLKALKNDKELRVRGEAMRGLVNLGLHRRPDVAAAIEDYVKCARKARDKRRPVPRPRPKPEPPEVF